MGFVWGSYDFKRASESWVLRTTKKVETPCVWEWIFMPLWCMPVWEREREKGGERRRESCKLDSFDSFIVNGVRKMPWRAVYRDLRHTTFCTTSEKNKDFTYTEIEKGKFESLWGFQWFCFVLVLMPLEKRVFSLERDWLRMKIETGGNRMNHYHESGWKRAHKKKQDKAACFCGLTIWLLISFLCFLLFL